jgi:hypothetical protein
MKSDRHPHLSVASWSVGFYLPHFVPVMLGGPEYDMCKVKGWGPGALSEEGPVCVSRAEVGPILVNCLQLRELHGIRIEMSFFLVSIFRHDIWVGTSHVPIGYHLQNRQCFFCSWLFHQNLTWKTWFQPKQRIFHGKMDQICQTSKIAKRKLPDFDDNFQ